ncbi:MAG: queuosine precursor transporter [Cyclobacteriaceae bacterium]|nr:queuosine precursor transporter [Cyclobacteriaceae bacterium HetDA_MAG_MS6]
MPDSSTSDNKKRQNLFIVLTGIFLTNAILAEMIGVKIFSGEKALGLAPANLQLLDGFVLDFNLTAGAVIWPIVFLSTDIINEYFGKKGVQKISFLAAGFIAYAFLIIYIITLLPPAQFWLDVNGTDPAGNVFNVDYAFRLIFRQGLGIIVGSLIAFLIGQLLDVFVFQRLRKITGSKMIWLRATGSTLVSQLIDSFVVLFIAFYFLAPEGSRWSIPQVTSVGIINYIYKFSVAIMLTPLIYVGHYLIDRYLGKDLAEQMTEEAANE